MFVSRIKKTFTALGTVTLALAVFFAFAGTASAGSAVVGQKIFSQKKCAGCHQITGPAKEKTIADQMKRKGPELWYAGSKFVPGFLEGWLKNPVVIRPMEYYSLTKKNLGTHVKLAPREASDVAAYLGSLRSAAVKPVGIVPTVDRRARIIFDKSQSCYGCHQVLSRRGRVVGGLTGPTLIGAGARLNPDWIFAYLTDSKTFKPVKDMPEYTGVLSRAEMAALSAYIS
ncbi:MAG: c-type cytochrome, partial [Proteobacteria bacterium]|nr:c-type cytochrome [Pseudomonadota bacterium]